MERTRGGTPAICVPRSGPDGSNMVVLIGQHAAVHSSAMSQNFTKFAFTNAELKQRLEAAGYQGRIERSLILKTADDADGRRLKA